MFKKGDLVVRTNKKAKPIIWRVMGVSELFDDSYICDHPSMLIHHFHKDEIRFAKNEEIEKDCRT